MKPFKRQACGRIAGQGDIHPFVLSPEVLARRSFARDPVRSVR